MGKTGVGKERRSQREVRTADFVHRDYIIFFSRVIYGGGAAGLEGAGLAGYRGRSRGARGGSSPPVAGGSFFRASLIVSPFWDRDRK